MGSGGPACFVNRVRHIRHEKNERENKKRWAYSCFGCCSFRAVYTHQEKTLTYATTFSDTSSWIFLGSVYCYSLPILQASSSRCSSSFAATARQAEQPQEVTAAWSNSPCFPFPVPHSMVCFTPFLNLEQSQEPMVWACSSPMQQISFSMLLSSLDWGRAVPHGELPAPCKAQVAEPRREPQSSRYKKGDER